MPLHTLLSLCMLACWVCSVRQMLRVCVAATEYTYTWHATATTSRHV